MLKCALRLLLVTCFVTGALSASNDPFVGEWKLNASKSKLIDVMKVESVAGNLISPTFKLAFVFAVFLLVLFVRPSGLLGQEQRG